MDSLKVLIAPDKFKGTLTASEAAMAIKKGWKKHRPQDDIEILPISDGGDGFGEAMRRLLRCAPVKAKAINAAHEECRSIYWFNEAEKIAVVESANVIGLAMLPKGKYHPFELDTYGLGILFRNIKRRNPLRVIVGLGGSATNDGGFGMARALGYKFINRNGMEIEKWIELENLKSIVPPETPITFNEVIAAVDVKNPLLGIKGASRIYGPQKGLKPDEIPFAEKNLKRLVKVVKDTLGRDYSKLPGAGAAGGLGFGLMTFLNARIESGFEIFSRFSRLEGKIKKVDVVITGEGSFDRSSLMGKGVGEIAKICNRYNKVCIVLAGKTALDDRVKKSFSAIFSMIEICGDEMALKQPSESLGKIAESAAKLFSKDNCV